MRPVPAHAARASDGEARAVIENFCLQCHDADHAKAIVLEDFDPAKADQRADVAEKMVRKLRAGMMPPAGGSSGAAREPRVADDSREQAGRGAARACESRTPHVPAPQPGRVRAGSPRHPRPRHRRQRVPAARYGQPQLRQHRRRGGHVADAARRLPARGGAGEQARGRRSRGLARLRDLQAPAARIAAAHASTARRSVRAAAYRSSTHSPPTASTRSA